MKILYVYLIICDATVMSPTHIELHDFIFISKQAYF